MEAYTQVLLKKKKFFSGLSRWYSGQESVWQHRGHRFDPWSGNIPHAEEQLIDMHHNDWACTLEPLLHGKRNRHSEKLEHHNEEQPPHSSKDPGQPKINKWIKLWKFLSNFTEIMDMLHYISLRHTAWWVIYIHCEMIITRSWHLSSHINTIIRKENIFFLWWELLWSTLLNNFRI